MGSSERFISARPLPGPLYRILDSPYLVLLPFYAVGVLGMSIPLLRPYFLLVTPALLVTNALLLLAYHGDWRATEVWTFASVALMGFGIEYLGVHTGVVFGDYYYTTVLGPALGSVPLTIGLNWLVLMYGAAALAHRALPSTAREAPLRRLARVLLGAALMTLLDMLMEPAAIQLAFWVWAQGDPPLQNYIGWFVTSLLMQVLGERLQVSYRSRYAIPLYVVQALFFMVLAFLGGLRHA